MHLSGVGKTTVTLTLGFHKGELEKITVSANAVALSLVQIKGPIYLQY